MKRIILSGAIMALLAGRLCAASAEDSKIFTPYFNMTLNEAAYLPSAGNIFSGGNINTQVGLLSKITRKDSLFGLYTFNYSGPAFQPQDSKQFTDRSMSHGFNFEYRRNLGEKFRVRPGVSLTRDYSRSGANEVWKSGLYNMNSSGLQLAVDYNFNFQKNGFITAMVLSKSVKFPNYTDLLTEFMNASNTAETSGGLQDQTLTQYSLRPNWNNFFGGYTVTLQNYKNQKVVEDTGVYGDSRQKDKTTTFDLGFHHTLWIFELFPTVSMTKHTSNQNFLRYKSFGAVPDPLTVNDGNGTADVTFVPKNYDYTDLAFVVPMDLLITSKWAIGGSINVIKRTYERGNRDADNNYDFSTKQKNLMTTFSGSIRKRMNDVAMLRLFYSLTVASSNNKFEKYMPYNYTGNTVGVAYQLSY
ncbi:MAG: hypothetical protein NTX59_12195 [Elusimicrobia bacterium]|nr:hypothetical protein [Elusimicrobiota bacterium]